MADLFINIIVYAIFMQIVTVYGFKMTLLHTNDIHSRFEQFNKYGSQCKQADAEQGKCFGGVARRLTKIQELRRDHDNVLLLDAGDQFTGTTFFTVHRGKASSYFMELLDYDVMCLGNHEFDVSVDELARFLDNVTFPVVSCNTDVTREPRLQGKLTKTWTTVIGGESVGVIGYTTPDTAQISTPGPTISFGDIVDCVKAEVSQLQGQGINKIIALGHAGFDADKEVAAVDGVDIVVGGHSNTFLYNGAQPSNDAIEGPYPVIIQQSGGNKGLVVQDFMWGKYLGYLNVTFDNNGVVTEYAGNPILLDSSVVENAAVLQQVAQWNIPMEQEMSKVIGSSKVSLVGVDKVCRLQECNLGNLITDAIVAYHMNFTHPPTQWAPAGIAFWNGGGIRASIDKGTIHVSDVHLVLPFGNEMDLATLTGKDIRKQLEHSVSNMNPVTPVGAFLQMSGMRVVYNLDMGVGKRVTYVEVVCLECDVPRYQPMEDNKQYKVYVNTFLLNGGDGFTFEPVRQEPFNTLDILPLKSYIQQRSPVYTAVEGRIRFDTRQTTSGSAAITMSHVAIIMVVLLAITMRIKE